MTAVEARHQRFLPDGAEDFGNGVISPNITDLINLSALSNSARRGADRLRGGFLNRKALPVFMSFGMLASVIACGPSNSNNSEQNLSPEQKAIVKAIQESEFQLPIAGKSHYLGGPHDTNLRGGIKNSIDIGPEVVVKCEPGVYKVLDKPPVVASASGRVKAIGDEKDRTDKLHSVIEIATSNGNTLAMMHLAQFKVSVGDEVIGGITEIAKFSCEYVPGGTIEGMHVHIALYGPDGEQIPIEGHTFSGFEVHDGKKDYDGTMSRANEPVRTANRARCGPSQASIDRCGGIRNDLITDSRALVVNSKKSVSPIPTIPIITPTIAVPLLRPAESPTRQAVIATATSIPRATETPRPNLQAAPTPKPFKIGDTVIVTGTPSDCLFTRSGPGLSSDNIYSASGKKVCYPDGYKFKIIGGPITKDGYNWWQVNLHSAWSEDKFLKLTPP